MIFDKRKIFVFSLLSFGKASEHQLFNLKKNLDIVKLIFINSILIS